jgi:hypothetical protein
MNGNRDNLHFSAVLPNIGKGVEDVSELIGGKVLRPMLSGIDGPFWFRTLVSAEDAMHG